MINEYDRVKTLVEKKGFAAGTVGVVVSIYKSGDVCEVEVWDSTDYPVDVITYNFSEIEVIPESEY